MNLVTAGDDTSPITVLSIEQSWELLSQGRLGRLVLSAAGRIDIFPINYVADRNRIFFRTAEGSKLVELTIHDDVVFEVDHVGEGSGWSVIVHGTARRLESYGEIAAVEELDLRSWIPTEKHNYVEIVPTEITGRQVRFGEE